MATDVKLSKDGTHIALSTRKTKARKKQFGVYPLAKIPVGTSSLLELSFADLDGSGRKSLLAKAPDLLPGVEGVTRWRLEHTAYQTPERPDPEAWDARDLPFPKRAPGDEGPILLAVYEEALPVATHVLRLVRFEGGMTDTFPEAYIKSPSDTVYLDLQTILDDDWLSKAEKPTLAKLHQGLAADLDMDRAAAREWGLSIAKYEIAVEDLNIFLCGLAPAWDDAEKDTHLGDGGGEFLSGLWNKILGLRVALHEDLEAARKRTLEDMVCDDVLTPGEMRLVRAEVFDIVTAHDKLLSAVDVAAYSAAVDGLKAFMAGLSRWVTATMDWDGYSKGVALDPGQGAALWGHLSDCRNALLQVSLRDIETAGDDGILDRREKKLLIQWMDQVDDERGRLVGWVEDDQAVRDHFFRQGVLDDGDQAAEPDGEPDEEPVGEAEPEPSPRVAAYNAVVAELWAYIRSLDPAWDDLTRDTPLGPFAFRAVTGRDGWLLAWSAYQAARDALTLDTVQEAAEEIREVVTFQKSLLKERTADIKALKGFKANMELRMVDIAAWSERITTQVNLMADAVLVSDGGHGHIDPIHSWPPS
jgi:hypothetical protein